MDELHIGDQTIRYDREQTRKAYSLMQAGDAERCGCAYCRNFAAQRTRAYPAIFLHLLDKLGIEADKEGEVYDCGPDESRRTYGGWFYFVGELVDAGERMTDASSGFQYFFLDAKHLPRPNVDFGKPVVAVEFITRVPWVIAEKP
jgi:hypothetical protein